MNFIVSKRILFQNLSFIDCTFLICVILVLNKQGECLCDELYLKYLCLLKRRKIEEGGVMMKQCGIKRGIILIILGTFLHIGMLHAKEEAFVPAAVLDGLKAMKPSILQLLATSEYSTVDVLRNRLKDASGRLKEFVEVNGAAIGLTDDESSSSTSSAPEKPAAPLQTVAPAPAPVQSSTTPAIIVTVPQQSAVVPAAEEPETTIEEVTPEPPAAALGAVVAPGGEAIQPPAVLAAPPIAAVTPVAIVPSMTMPEASDAPPAMEDSAAPTDALLEAPVDLGMPAMMPIGDLSTLPPLGGVAPAQPMPGVMMPQSQSAPMFQSAPVAPATAPLFPALPALPPLTYSDLDDLDHEIGQLMAMSIPSSESLETLSLYDQSDKALELMSVSMQDVPEIMMDESLDDLHLSDLTLAGLE